VGREVRYVPVLRAAIASAGMALMALVSAGCQAHAGNDAVSEELAQEVAKVASQDERVRSFADLEVGCDRRITALEPEAVTLLSEEQPVVYGGLPARMLYRIEYSSGGRGVLAIVDVEQEKVLRCFQTVGVDLSSTE